MNAWILTLLGAAIFIKVTCFILVVGAAVYYGKKFFTSLTLKKQEDSKFESSKDVFNALQLKYVNGELSKDEFDTKVKELANAAELLNKKIRTVV